MKNTKMIPVLGCVALLAACAHGGSASASSASPATANGSPGTVAATAPANAPNGAEAHAGGSVFATNCSSCHGATGDGLPGAFPPLAGNASVLGDPTSVIHIVKYGLTGKIVVKGQTYNGMMPAWSGNLSDAQIAEAITYVRASWGNHAGAVTPAQVTAVKK